MCLSGFCINMKEFSGCRSCKNMHGSKRVALAQPSLSVSLSKIGIVPYIYLLVFGL